jgi:hypothetical protein
MSDDVRVFVNERPILVAPGSRARDAVQMADPALAAALDGGTAFLTDGVGRAIDPGTVVETGAILRAGLRARRPAAG